MKLYQYSILALAALGFAACDDINDIKPEGDGISTAEVTEAVALVPSRAQADFTGMFSMMGEPYYYSPSSGRADDFGFIMSAISQDAEGPDLQFPNSGYNWFSVCGELSSRTPTYANPLIRYATPYSQLKIANDLLRNYIADEAQLDDEAFVKSLDSVAVNTIAQSLAIRAFDYLSLAPYFQFSYAAGAQDEPCVPLVTLSTPDPTHNARATVKAVYDQIIKDLTWAIAHLDAKRATKANININVAYGLRARAYLATEQWKEAAADAEKAAAGYEPYSINEVSVPAFYEISDHNWIWGYDMTPSMANSRYATSPSWIGSFSKQAYSAGAGCYAFINKLLFDKIPDTDVRKGWWVDENLHSPLLDAVDWDGVTGDAISTLQVAEEKEPFIAYTNVKFGVPSMPKPTSVNDSDWPFMRVEEMLLIQAEGYAKSGDESKAKKILTDFVTNYRDPEYKIPISRTLADEIWFQRRVELWGEGFGWSDMMRLNKPLVRFHDDSSNYPEAYKFNLPAKDPWMLMRFPQRETNTNFDIVNNTGGVSPTTGINPTLRDGVTD
ncbi:MAG: RagB/SusD family nutrient uptake outer membrane protein [Bacteroidaceae bacterium]|nr:RagB/SusD family nutrient uptake outer membrane protein [Bacteroidaceae bacterium]